MSKYSHIKIGDEFGNLLVVASKNKKHFNCLCSNCGNFCEIRKDSILQKTHCGCLSIRVKYNKPSNRKCYNVWKKMFQRCGNADKRSLTYTGCYVDDKWHDYNNFQLWYEKQDSADKFLDKDIKILGNKVYSEDTCMLVSRQVNNLLTLRANDRGNFPLGVCYRKRENNYEASISVEGKRVFLGSFSNPLDAHFAWCKAKSFQIETIAKQQNNLEVKEALERISLFLNEHVKNRKIFEI